MAEGQFGAKNIGAEASDYRLGLNNEKNHIYTAWDIFHPSYHFYCNRSHPYFSVISDSIENVHIQDKKISSTTAITVHENPSDGRCRRYRM